jgi:hypothetical protein
MTPTSSASSTNWRIALPNSFMPTEWRGASSAGQCAHHELYRTKHILENREKIDDILRYVSMRVAFLVKEVLSRSHSDLDDVSKEALRKWTEEHEPEKLGELDKDDPADTLMPLMPTPLFHLMSDPAGLLEQDLLHLLSPVVTNSGILTAVTAKLRANLAHQSRQPVSAYFSPYLVQLLLAMPEVRGKTDALNRRLRFAPPNPALRPKTAPRVVQLTEADVLVFEALDRHGPLPVHYLFEFQKHLRGHYPTFQYRLRDLFHGDARGS